MHVMTISKRAGGKVRGAGPLRGTLLEGWNEYEESWLYLMLFLVASIFVPQKL